MRVCVNISGYLCVGICTWVCNCGTVYSNLNGRLLHKVGAVSRKAFL